MWCVIVGAPVPSDIYGPMTHQEAAKFATRLKIRAKQMDEEYKGKTIAVRSMSNPSNHQLDQIINNIHC